MFSFWSIIDSSGLPDSCLKDFPFHSFVLNSGANISIISYILIIWYALWKWLQKRRLRDRTIITEEPPEEIISPGNVTINEPAFATTGTIDASDLINAEATTGTYDVPISDFIMSSDNAPTYMDTVETISVCASPSYKEEQLSHHGYQQFQNAQSPDNEQQEV